MRGKLGLGSRARQEMAGVSPARAGRPGGPTPRAERDVAEHREDLPVTSAALCGGIGGVVGLAPLVSQLLRS